MSASTPYLVNGESIVIPTGVIIAWPMESDNYDTSSGNGPGTGWLECDGSAFNTTTYATLYTLLGKSTVPNLVSKWPRMAVSTSGVTGSNNVTIPVNDVVEHSHASVDLTHTHGLNHGADDGNFTGGNVTSIHIMGGIQQSHFAEEVLNTPGIGYASSDIYFDIPRNDSSISANYNNGDPNITIANSSGANADQVFDCNATGGMYVRYFIKAD
jgi:microcystin-dependent protein